MSRFSARADSRSLPNGFSMMTRARVSPIGASPDWPRPRIAGANDQDGVAR